MESPRRLSRFPRPGDHGPADGGEPPRRRLRGGRLEPDARSKAEDFGGQVAATPAEAAAATGVVISMVPDVPEVEQVLLGPDGAAEGLGEGGLCIDMSTIAPTAARAIAERLAERGIDFLDAPVTGSRPEGRGRDAHDHGGRSARAVGARAPAVRGDGPAGDPRRADRSRRDGQADQQHGGGDQRRRGRRGPRAGARVRAGRRRAAAGDRLGLGRVGDGSS